MSDLDVWVIVKDESIETIAAERQRYAAQLERPVLLLESPQNAPAGGAYLMALYPGQSGVHQGQEEWRTTLLPPVHRAEQMAMLRQIAREMEHLTNAIELIGGQVPSRAIPHVYDFFDLADALLQQRRNRAGVQLSQK